MPLWATDDVDADGEEGIDTEEGFMLGRWEGGVGEP